MIKVTVELVANLMGLSPAYVRVLLHRRGINLNDKDSARVFDLVSEYRMRNLQAKSN